MPESTYHQIHFAWAEPTLLGRTGPGPSASSLPEPEQPALRSWRDRLLPALTADYRALLPGGDPATRPETLWSRAYPDGQAALVYRWPGEVRSAHAWAIVGPARGLTLPRILALHENPHTRPDPRRPPAPGWSAMPVLSMPGPWERTAAPGAVRTRDRRAAETSVEGEPILVGAVASALHRPDLPVHLTLAPERADLWQAVQLRFLWGMHRVLHDVLTPPDAVPAAGWSWSFSTYEPALGGEDSPHLAFAPPTSGRVSPFRTPPAADHRKVAERLVEILRDEGGDALAAHLAERGVPDAPTFADRRALLSDWLDPAPRPARDLPPVGDMSTAEDLPPVEPLPDEHETLPDPLDGPPETLEDLPEAEPPGEEETGPRQPPGTDVPVGRIAVEPAGTGPGEQGPGGDREQGELPQEDDVLWPEQPRPLHDEPAPGPDTEHPVLAPRPDEPAEDRTRRPRLAPAEGEEHPLPEPDRSDAEPPVPEEPAVPEAAVPEPAVPEAAVPAPVGEAPAGGGGDADTDAELWRIREERDRYHAELQGLRRELARLDRPWPDLDGEEPGAEPAPRRWPGRLAAALLALVLLGVGLEIGARSGTGALDLLGMLGDRFVQSL
ncbi:hypothetical protein ACOALZ_12805 [Nocardiopsis algeriensis]|uniref:hypothetical protein n=1 Tax=Nocardiopsis algeriensis TaxID=1478215 RepID=UPI003B433630